MADNSYKSPFSPENIETEASKADENTSTVFSAPEEHKDVQKGGMKLWKKIVCVLLAVAVIGGGTFAVIKLIPEKDDYAAPSETQTLAIADVNSFSEITVKNARLEPYTIRSEIVEGEKGSEIVWSLDGYDNDLIDQTSLSLIASYAASITYMKDYPLDDGNRATYGLDVPVTVVEVKTRDGKSFTMNVGKKSQTASGSYIEVSLFPGKVYLAVTAAADGFVVTPLDLAVSTKMKALDTEKVPSSYLTDGEWTSFDRINLTGGEFGDLEFVPNTNSELNAYATYIVTKPNMRVADNVDVLFGIFTDGLSTSGTVSFDKSPETLKKYGLDNPDIVLSITLGGNTYSYKLKQLPDDKLSYYVISDYERTVRVCTSTSVTFLAEKSDYFFARFMLLESVKDIKGLSFAGDLNASFTVNYDSENEEYTVSIPTGEISESEFRNAYGELVATTVFDYEIVTPTSPVNLTVTLKHSNGSADTVLSFRQSAENRYMFYLGGTPMGQITSSSYNSIIKNFRSLNRAG